MSLFAHDTILFGVSVGPDDHGGARVSFPGFMPEFHLPWLRSIVGVVAAIREGDPRSFGGLVACAASCSIDGVLDEFLSGGQVPESLVTMVVLPDDSWSREMPGVQPERIEEGLSFWACTSWLAHLPPQPLDPSASATCVVRPV